MLNNKNKLYLERYILAFVVTIISFSVLIGWYLHIPLLIQVHPTFAPMQFNTALCFFSISIAVILTNPKSNYRKYFALLFALIALIISGLTLIEYLFYLNLGIDQLFMKHYIMTETSHPGRMAPNTALCFLLSSFILILYNYFHRSNFALFLCISFLIIALLLGLLSVLGYFIGIRALHNWGNLTGMAIHTGTSFLLISLALFRLIISPYLNQSILENIFLPALINGFGIFFFLISWQLLTTYQYNRIKEDLNKNLTLVENEVQITLTEYTNRAKNLFNQVKWLEKNHLINNFINQFMNENQNLVLLSYHNNLNQRNIYLNTDMDAIDYESYLKSCLQTVNAQGSANLIQTALTKNLFCIYQKKLNIIVIYHINQLIDRIMIHHDFNQLGLSISSKEDNYYQKNNGAGPFFINQWGLTQKIKIDKHNLTIKLWPNEAYIHTKSDHFLLVYLTFGLIIIFLLTLITRYTQLIYIKNKKLHAQHQQLEKMAFNDFLTGIPNRLRFENLATQSIFRAKRHQKPLAILLLDLDGFKPVNDTYGHAIGDLLLKEVAQLLTSAVRTNDTVSRIGGDEFAVTLEDANFNGAVIVAKKLISLIEKPIIIENLEINISTSIGISIYPEDGDEIAKLLKKADIALYQAKKLSNGSYYPREI